MGAFLDYTIEDDVTLAEALVRYGALGSSAIGLFYSPTCCVFAQVDTIGHVSGPKHVDLAEVFEARVFNEMSEMRWLNKNAGCGRSVMLTEMGRTDLESGLEPIDGTYLLWGSGVSGRELPEGWSMLAEPRIGALPVPVTGVSDGDHVLLHVREYPSVADEHGNVTVAEERLIGLEVKHHV